MNNKPIIIIYILFLALSLQAQTFNEILGRPTNSSITINALFDVQVNAYFEYGTVSGIYAKTTEQFTTVVGEPLEVKISELLPETRYYYRTRYKKPSETTYKSGPERNFITQRMKGSSFTFTIESDPHPYDPKGYHPLWDICLNNQLNDHPDFMFDLGDTFGDDHLDKVTNLTRTSAQVKQLMLDNRPHFGNVCHSMPFFFCQGNHEGEFGYYLLQTPPENLATYETIWRKMYYPNPEPDEFYSGNKDVEAFGMDKPENYYAFEWGDALFVVVDGWRYSTANIKPRNWEWTIVKTQYDWLKKTLETSTAKYKFVFTHHVMGETRGGINVATGFEWGGLDNGTNKFAANRPGWEMPIHQLMVKNKVNILFQGHDHVFAKEELDNIVYQTLQMPSDSSYSLGIIANGSAFNGKVLAGSGHLRVTVTPDSVKVDYVNAKLAKDETPTSKNGDIIYSYSVKPKTVSGINQLSLNGQTLDCSIFPNPTANEIHIKFNQTISNELLAKLISMDGKILNSINLGSYFTKNEYISLQPTDFNGNKLNAGLYFISIQNSAGDLLHKPLIITK
ncbi:MAG: metallophosphoesterase [Paludibacter sp.]